MPHEIPILDSMPNMKQHECDYSELEAKHRLRMKKYSWLMMKKYSWLMPVGEGGLLKNKPRRLLIPVEQAKKIADARKRKSTRGNCVRNSFQISIRFQFHWVSLLKQGFGKQHMTLVSIVFSCQCELFSCGYWSIHTGACNKTTP